MFQIEPANGVANNFTLDYSTGTFVVPGRITFNGGALPGTPSNSLTIIGGSFDTDTFNFSTAHNGSIQLGTNGQMVNYTNMTPLTNTGTATDAVFNLPDGTVAATLDAASGGTVQLVSGNGTFETTTFAAPSGSLTVNSGNGSDTVTATSNFYNNFNANLTVHGAASILPLHGIAVGTIAATEGATLTETVALFSDPNGAGAASDYFATVDWGDGTNATTASISGPDANGEFTVTGTHTYANVGDRTITVLVNDNGGSSATITSSAAVSGTSQPVDATEDIYVIGSGTVSVAAAKGLLANDTDGAGALAVVAGTVSGAEGGTFVFNADGSFSYTPPASFRGFDYASYTAKDAFGDQGTATVNVLSQTGGVVWKFYESVIHRDPDYGGLHYWINDFLNGGKTGDIAVGFFESTELLNQIITGYYEQYLSRAPDSGGLSFYENLWRKTGGPEQIKAGFAASPEFNALAKAQYGAYPAGWLEALYHRILNRIPDSKGFNNWLLQIAGGTSQYQVALDFFTSPEAFDNDVTGWYYEYLGRAPTLAEQAQYARQMTTGATDREIEQEITNLPEYADNPPAASVGTGVALQIYLPPWSSSSQRASVAAKDSVFSQLGG